MKKIKSFVLFMWLIMAIVAPQVKISAQPLTDSTVNYFTLTAYYDHYFDSLIQVRGEENMRGTGYKDYLRWKWLYNGRHGEDGELGAVWDSINAYFENREAPENYINESDWQFSGPYGFPVGYNGQSEITGKGMALSLWVSPGKHQLMYVGSHHGGLWKTTDGGQNWYPLHDDVDDPIIHGVNSIAVDPEDFDKIYITCNSSVGETYDTYSAGVFKSVDGGNTWNDLVIDDVVFPEDWDYALRKIVIDPENPEILYLITYRDVFRSLDEGANWNCVFHREYLPWGSGSHKGLFDFKITPWDENRRAYLAGSEIYTVEGLENNEPQFDNISTNVLDIPNEGTRYGNPLRCEISMDKHYNNIVWFFYTCEYDKGNGKDRYYRVVKCDGNEYDLIFENNVGNCDIQYSDFKLEFSVSPSNPNIFYAGGTDLSIIDVTSKPTSYSIKDGSYPEMCWVHDDIREMQIFSDGLKDTLFIADDSGISWGTDLENAPLTCNASAWNWSHPCTSTENGLNITEFYGIGLFKNSPDLLAGGCQDLGSMLLNGDEWLNFGSGDGSEVVWDPYDENILYFSDWCNRKLYRTNTLGETYNISVFYTFDKNGLFIPMELDPWNKSVSYSGEDHLLKFSGVDIFPDPPVVTDLLNTTFPKPLSDIEVVKTGTDSRRFYFSTLMDYSSLPTPPPEETVGCLFKTIGDGNNMTYEDIGSNLAGCDHGFINDIEVNPNSISTIWVAFAVYSKNGNPKVFRTVDEGANWENYAQGLPPGLPVFKLKYDSKYGNLYAATDVGVFVRNINAIQGEWNPFNNNLPANKIVTDIEINPDFNAIYAATFGRGLWKSSLHCDYNSEPFIVDGIDNKLTWTTNHTMEQSILIHPGKTLEIRDCYVYMPSEAKIVVERGGQLILDGGTLTSACNDLWWGVELQGDSRNIQTENYQGKIVLKKGAVIEDARKAVFCGKNIENTYPDWNYTGGIVDATGSTFRNNKFGVMIWRYNDRDRDYNCTFSDCNFLTTKALKDGLPPRYFLTLIQVKGISIENCDFNNSVSDNIDYQDRGTGIFAYDGGFDIDPVPGSQHSNFHKLNYGIYALNYEQDLPFTLNSVTFSNNLTGVYASGLSGIGLFGNTFDVPKAELPTNRIFGGVYLNYCTGFTITTNNFEGLLSGSDHDGETNVGITINNSGEDNNDIYLNYFTNMYIGILAQNVNRSKFPLDGLKLRCNEFTTNEYDITVTADPWCSDLCGIARNQGTTVEPAGNLFSKTGIHDFSDYNNEKEYIDYYHHAIPLDEQHPRWKPEFYTRLTIGLHGTGVTYNEDACPPMNLESEARSYYMNQYASVGITIDSLEAQIAQLVDGGSTDDLNQEISQALPSEAVELNDELLENSPYLSDTVLVNVAGKEDVLLTEMVTDIMIANPQSAKSVSVLEALESRENPLTEEMMDAVLAGRDTVSEKEILEAELSHARSQRELALNRLIDIYRQDTIDSQTDSIINLLQKHPSLSAKYRLMMIYLGQGDSISVHNTLDSIPAQFPLTSRQSLIHDHWNEWIELVLALQADSSNISNADSLQITSILSLSQNEDLPGCIANNALQFLSWTETEPHYVLPGDQLKNKLIREKPGKEKSSETQYTIKLYPNPASGYIIVEYSPNQGSNNGLLQVFTSAGRLYYAMELFNNRHFQSIDTNDWPCGIYFYKYTGENSIGENGKIIIIK